jgi:acetyl esterase/lipase
VAGVAARRGTTYARKCRGVRPLLLRQCLGTLALGLLLAVWAAPSARADSRYLDFTFAWNVQSDLEYGRAPDKDGNEVSLRLDLYQPVGDVAPARPVLIYAHGGAFTKGFKDSTHDAPYPINFAGRGFVAASIDYRLDGSEQEATDDMQAAVRWFRAHASEYRIDPNRIAVIGSSSGAVMALSTAFAPEDAGSSGNPGYPSNVAAGLSISGDSQHPDTITAGDPPIAMFHAQDDTTIPYAAAQATCEETKAMGNVCDFYSYPSGGHPPPFAINNREDIAEKSSDFMVRREAIDTLRPVTGDDVPSTYRAHPAAVTLDASDDGGSGFYRTYYRTGVDPPAPTTASAAYDPSAKPTLGDGERIRYFSIDRAGNAEAVRTSAAAKVDGAAPATTDDVPAGYRAHDVTVTLAAADDGGSGVDATYYTTGADPPAPTAASHAYDPSSKPVLGDGERIRYFSIDRAGNAEAVRTSAAAKVDAVAPATNDDVPAGYRAHDVTVTLDASDSGGSGLAQTYYTTGADPPAPTTASQAYDSDAKPVLGDGARISYFSTDGAGNAEPVRTSAAAKVDATPPATTDDVPAGYRAHDVTVTLAAADDGGSGVDATYYTTGADPPAPTAASQAYDPDAKPVLGDGERISYFSTDGAGNAEPVRTSGAAEVDTEAPTSEARATSPTVTPAMTVDYATADQGAGVDRVELYARGPGDSEYSLADTASPAQPTGSLGYRASEGPGDYDFYTVAYDAVGNAEPAAASADAVETLVPRTRAAALASNELAAGGDGSIAVPLTNPNPFDVSGQVTVNTARAVAVRPRGPSRVRRIGSASFSIHAGGGTQVAVTMPPALRQVLAERGRLWLRVTRATTGAGGARTATTIVRVRAPAVRGY